MKQRRTEERFALYVELDGDAAPTEFRILAAGDNPTRKGLLVFDDSAAQSVSSEYEAGGVELPLDYDHAMADPMARPADRIAAGWFKPEIRGGELWASDVRWTPKGKAAVEAREYRYTSLWGDVEPLDKKGSKMRLTRLRNVALTNTPATIGTLPLVASEVRGDQMSNLVLSFLEVSDESEALEKIQATSAILADAAGALGVSSEAIGAAVRALVLRAEAGDAAVAELSAVRAREAEAKRDALIAQLSEAGQLPPALHSWARTQSIESLETFGAHAPRIVETKAAPVAVVPPSGPSVALTEEEKSVAKALGLSIEKVAIHKAALVAEEI
jgi:phage I-like protein